MEVWKRKKMQVAIFWLLWIILEMEFQNINLRKIRLMIRRIKNNRGDQDLEVCLLKNLNNHQKEKKALVIKALVIKALLLLNKVQKSF